jgi:lysophospholipase L1-like esterase
MKHVIIVLAVLLSLKSVAQTVMPATDYTFKGSINLGGKNAATDASAHMEIGPNGTNKTLILPRITDTSAIISPKSGAIIYLISDGTYRVRKNGYWLRIDQIVIDSAQLAAMLSLETFEKVTSRDSITSHNIDFNAGYIHRTDWFINPRKSSGSILFIRNKDTSNNATGAITLYKPTAGTTVNRHLAGINLVPANVYNGIASDGPSWWYGFHSDEKKGYLTFSGRDEIGNMFPYFTINRKYLVGLGRTGTTGSIDASAILHIAPGSDTVPQLKLTEGLKTTAPQSGAVEFNAGELYFSQNDSTRNKLTYSPNCQIVVPSEVFAVEGVETNIYFREIILTDWGDAEFRYRIDCAKGNQYTDRWSFIPVAADSGTYAMRINVLYRGSIITYKDITVKSTKRSAGSGSRSIILIGDSQTESGTVPDTIKNNYGSDAMVLNFKGQFATPGGNYTQTRSGWAWPEFTTAGRTYYSFAATGVSVKPIYLESFYTNNSSTFRCTGDSLTGGNGRILFYRTAGTNTPLSSGTLTRSIGPGDNTISYSSWYSYSSNPFWKNGSMNISNYLTSNSITMSTGDWFMIQLGTNDIFRYKDSVQINKYLKDTLLVLVDTMINAIRAAVPSARIGIATIVGGSPQDAFGTQYGCLQTAFQFRENALRYNKVIIGKYDNSTYKSGGTYIIPVGANVDMINNIKTEIAQYNKRSPETYIKPNDGVHPDVTGESQFADSYYSIIKWYK